MGDTRATVTLAANLDPSGVLSAVKAMQGAFNNLKLPNNIGEGLDKSLSKATDLLKKYQSQLAKGVDTKTDAKNITKTGAQINEVLDDINHYINELNGQQIFLKADVSGLNKLQTNIEKARTAWKNAIQEFRKNSDIDTVLNGIGGKTTRSNLTQGSISKAKTLFDKGDLEGYRNALDEIYNRVSKLKDTTISNVVKGLGLDDAGSKADNLTLIKTQLEAISKLDFSTDENVKAQFDEITNSVSAYENEVKRAGNAGQQAFNDINANKAVNDTRALVTATDQYTDSLMSAKGQVQDLQRSTQYFFSLRNMINLLKRGVDDAIQSVKELDAAMTETAVVTDYKVSDLWGMLPQYTQLANQLGATTQGAYETMTLYFQQGLDQQAAFEIGAETMKMARIAGLEYAETTDMMTAALRGFNMELNETSAKRINDVYSELAAITASDTEELGTAMQRTASIAHSAGMSFEGTTAFLAQAIETTREPAENIGTAMKTIVARFQEMKENPLEISEVDGEEVNYNKVDAALKSIGVSLKDTNGQFRELDQVFLDISSRWDSLSQTQQRYIATVAAGSRQQSRFIAMMDNYDRTVQLFEAANNSAGASDEQFGKTMDSLESKLNKLHNAWQAFTMGIANNGMIKLAVDGLTGFLTVTNKIIDTLSLGSGAIKSFLSVFAAFTGLKMAGRAANSLIGGLGGLVDPQSTVKEGLKIGLFGQGKTNAQAQAITTPIVGVLNKISGQIAQIKNNGINNKRQSNFDIRNTSKQEYLDIRKQFDKLSGKEGFKMSEASSLFSKMDAKHQQSMFNNNPGTKFAMKQASLAWFGSRKDLSKAAIQEGQTYINSIYKGMEQGRISVDKGIELIGQPQKWGYYLGTETAMAYSKSFVQKSIPTIKENTTIAHEAAIASLGFNPQDYKVGSKELKDLFKNDKQLANEYASLYGGFRGDLDKDKSHGQAKGKVSDLGRFANDIGAIGDRFSQAGYGITAFGNALSQLGGPLGTIGSGISAMGSAITTMGMSISGVTGIISLFTVGIQDAAGATVIAGSTIAAVAAPLAILAAGFLLAKTHLQKVKEAGEEVTKTFNDTNKEVDGNISKLKSYQSEFATLAQGVDSNGNNVSLDDSQYQRYLEIVNDIAAINPEIVQGYNAQGHAIIDNNKALDETLKKQQQIKKETLDTYTKTGSLQKLINARNINKDYKQIQSTKQSGVADGSGHGNEGRSTSIGSAVPLAGDVSSIVDKLRLIKGFDPASLKKFGIESLDNLLEGEEQAVKNFIKHRNQIQAELANSGIELNEGLIKGFDKLNEDQKAFDEAIQPVYDNLLASISNSPFYEEIGSEFKSAIALGLKDIASQDLNASEMQAQANSLIQEFDNLTRAGGEYATAMEQVEGAQDKFAASLDASEYAKNTEGALNTLNSLLKEYEGNTTAYGQAVTEYLTNQIEKIKNFTQEGTVSLTEALNTATNEIAAAEGAYEAFQDATKSDMSTGADNMKSIFDEITKETDGIQLHMQGKGDNTLWQGMEALFSEDAIQKAAEKGPEAVQSMLNRIKPMLQEGQAGFDAFWNDMFSEKNAAKLEKIKGVMIDRESGEIKWDDDINPDVFHEMADALGYADQYLTSMLNKGRQFANINFMDISDVRKALATDESAIKGTSTSTITNEQGKQEKITDIFVKGDYLKNALREAHIANPVDQKEAIDNITKNGVKIIPNPNDITKKDFKNMGITDLPSLIRTLGDTGQFNRSEIEEYAQQMSGYDAGEFDTVYKDYLDSQDHPELPSINSIDSNVASILGLIAHEHGQLTQEDKEAYDKAKQDTIGELGVADTIPQLFAKGLNKNGEKLSKDEFNQTQKNLDKQAEAYTKAEAFYTNLAQKAKEVGDTEAEKEAQKYANDYKKWAQDIRDYKQSGIEKYKENQEKKNAPIPGKDSTTIAQEEKTKATKLANEREIELLERHNKEKEAINQAYTTKEEVELKKDVQNRQAERQRYEQQAQNASGPTEGLVEKDSTYKPYALNSVGTEVSHLLSEKTNDIFKAINPIDAVKKALDSQLASSEIQQQGFVIDEKYAAYAGQANEAFINEIKTGAIKLGSFIKEGYDSLTQAEDSIPNQETTFVTKVTTSAQKLGEALKRGWDSLQSNTPPEPATQSVPTVNKGTTAVANIAQEVVQNVSTKEKGVDETQQKLDKISSTANKGATMPVSAAMSATVNAAQTALQNLQNKASKGANVKTTVDSKGADSARSAASKVAEMPLKIRDLATSVINKINASARQPVTKTVNISPNYTGTWRKDVYIGKTGPGANNLYTGANNKISFHHVPMAGSLARGTKKGRIGPRNQGGLTLTGEEGYEIAWIPSESRSTILGASGPEMVNLPKEAVVYNHDQSKEIMKKRKSIPAGSMGSGSASYKPAASTTTSTATITRNNNTTISKSLSDAGKKVQQDSKEAKEKIARVSVWWENIARRAEAIQRQADKNQKEYEKYLKNVKATLHTTGTEGQGNAFIKNTNKAIKKYTDQLDRATADLINFDYGTKGQQKAAKTKKNKKDDKKANKKAYLKDRGGAVQISYEGKKKGKKTTINELVATSKYIKEQNGTYVIDYKAVKKSTKKNKKKRQPLVEELNKEINDRISKKNTAEDNIQKAQEALEKFSQELYDTFFAWEIELTKIQNITQKIEALTGKISRRNSMEELIKAQTKAGALSPQEAARQRTQNFNKRLADQQTVLRTRRQAIDQSTADLQNKATGKNIQTEIAQVTKNLKAATKDTDKRGFQKALDELQKKQDIYTTATQNYVKYNRNNDGTYSVDFNTAALERDKWAGKLSADMAKGIQDFAKELEDGSKELDELLQSQTDGLTELYDTLNNLNDEWADYESQLIDMNEEANQKQIEEIRKLNDSLKKSMDDLLNAVKKKLDERRKQEDNLKTEQDISRKQQRLTMLRADTSGGHQVEIAQLEREIADSQQNYQRTLEDQLLEKLQNQADEASEQRERQIELQEAIVDSVGNIEEVQKWMLSPEEYRQEIWEQYKILKDYDSKNTGLAGKAKIASEFSDFMSGLLSNRQEAAQVSNAINDTGTLESAKQKKTEDIDLSNMEAVTNFNKARNKLYETAKNITASNYSTAQGQLNTVVGYWNQLTPDQKTLTNFDNRTEIEKKISNAAAEKAAADARKKAADAAAAKAAADAAAKAEQAKKEALHQKEVERRQTFMRMYNSALAAYKNNKKISSAEINNLFSLGKQFGLGKAAVLQNIVSGKPFTWKNTMGAILGANGINRWNLLKTFPNNSALEKALSEYLGKKISEIKSGNSWKNAKAFATGGLNTYTGPAWLDGTPSKPELVLNAQDTKNFIALKDVLSKAIGSTSHIENSYGGDANFEININVDHISSDYDVNKVVDQVEKRIVQKSGYRNVTQVRNFR